MSGSGTRWAICKSAPRTRETTTPAPHRSVFYRPDALPAAQPTVSKHWRHQFLFLQFLYLEHIFTVDMAKTLKGRLKIIQCLQQKNKITATKMSSQAHVQHSRSSNTLVYTIYREQCLVTNIKSKSVQRPHGNIMKLQCYVCASWHANFKIGF